MKFQRAIIIGLIMVAIDLSGAWDLAQAQSGDASCMEDCRTFMPLVTDNYHPIFIFRDDFSEPSSGWPTVSDEFVAYGYYNNAHENDAYEMTIKQAGGVAGVFRDHEWPSDYSVTVSARVVSGSQFVYGLIFYTSDADDEIHLFLDDEGRYSIQRFTGGHYQILVNWQSNAAVRPAGESNELSAKMLGDEYVVLINGVEVTRGEYVRSGETPGIGLILFSSENFESPATVRFDDLTLRRIQL